MIASAAASGYFVADDERDGKPLWRVPLNATIKTSPMTFASADSSSSLWLSAPLLCASDCKYARVDREPGFGAGTNIST
jgi:hypothetical protein